MDQTTAVRARDISESFGDVVALDGVDLDVEQGRIHGLVGPNGAGKTTLLGLLLGLAVADGGQLEILGSPVGSRPAVPDGVAGFVDGPGLYPSLTARQNLAALVALRGSGPGNAENTENADNTDGADNSAEDADDIDEVLEQVGLREVAGDRIRGFSLGMRQRLGLAAALLTKPRLLVLDEPANGLDPAGTRQVHRVLSRLAAASTAVVLSSHRMDDLAALCSEVTILNAGRVMFSGPLAELASATDVLDYRVRTDEPARARLIAQASDLTLLPPDEARPHPDDSLLVRCSQGELDDLVVRLVRAEVAIRELAPTVAPLEAAFLALCGDDSDAPGGAQPVTERGVA
ncbi:ABC transporter ATP-binding protein [Microlunatus elymi]|uniref:ABC transporter ATP-binding protein n=1 Tax=Microlunatus elymi TaxID=2596828 RepID=A0A516PUA1_9ACTN|nr:ABC transporter ATP-binding protein [Microlunatus elymi]QDP94729.1 ABC transporter ATP-binding protein [Microlunatus elymi]